MLFDGRSVSTLTIGNEDECIQLEEQMEPGSSALIVVTVGVIELLDFFVFTVILGNMFHVRMLANTDFMRQKTCFFHLDNSAPIKMRNMGEISTFILLEIF